MTTVEIIRTSKVDAAEVIRRSPWREVPGADRTLAECLMMSVYSWVGTVDDEVACAWGLIPPSLLSERAYLWLITTDLVDQHQFRFVRASQRVMEAMLEKFPIIIGHCDVKHPRSVQWLKWLGADFFEAEHGQLTFQIRKK